jgi:hypothetical protein
MYLTTRTVERLTLVQRAADAGDWVAMLMLEELGAEAHWRQRAIAAGASEAWRCVEEVLPPGIGDPRQRIVRAVPQCAVDLCRTFEDGHRLMKKVARRRCLAIDRMSAPVMRWLVMRRFGRERAAAAAHRAGLLLSASRRMSTRGA